MFINGGSVRFDLTFFGFDDVNFPLSEQNIDLILNEVKKQLLKPHDYGATQEYTNEFRHYRISGRMDFGTQKKVIKREG